MLYPSVRHRTQQQLAEQHALGTKIFRILSRAGYLRVKIRRRVILADKLVLSSKLLLAGLRLIRFLLTWLPALARHGSPSSCFLRPALSPLGSCRSPATG